MRSFPTAQSVRLWLPLLAAAGALASCRDGGPTANAGVRSVVLSAPSLALRPGFVMQVFASALDADGRIIDGRKVTWRSLTPSTLAVSEDGIVLALVPGVGVARASVGSVSAQLQLALVNPPIARLVLGLDSLRLSLPGGARALTADARDADSIPIVAPALTWESTASRIASVSVSGQVNAIAVGRSRIIVRGDEREATVEVIVDAPPSPTGPVIAGIAPSLVLPGQRLVVNGTAFSASAGANTVLIDGTPIPVTSATATQLVLAVPAAAAFACEPTHVVALQVGTSGGIGVTPVTLQVATKRTLAPGESFVFTSATDAHCNELTPAAGRYVLTVPNAARAIGAGPMSVTLRGIATMAAGALRSEEPPGAASGQPHALRQQRPSLQLDLAARARTDAHARVLAANIDLLTRVRPPAIAARSTRPGAALVTPTVGSVQAIRIPNIGQPGLCDAFTPIGARTIFVGAHVVLLEDTASVNAGQPTLAGQMDDTYNALGAELESTVWPIVQRFGNSLVMDGRLDDNGRVMFVFTPRMNQKLSGSVLAAVVNCDFFPRAQFAASNVGEYLYAQVPTAAAAGFGPGTRARWLYEMRATLAHELKHVTSFAERIVRGQPLEEQWLEEATARHAEELFARAVNGTQRNGNAGFAATLACELHAGDPAYPACADTPRAMRPHFEALWTFLDAPSTYSPLGPTAAGDFSFYGSGWALTRWLLDQEGLVESTVFTALTTSGQAGITNLEGRTGRNWDEMLPEWSLAMATDDLDALVTTSPRIRFPSWDLRSVFRGFCDVLGPCVDPLAAAAFPRPYPLRPLPLDGGAFTLELPAIAPGGFAAIELSAGTGVLKQVIELKGYRGGALPGTARLGIIRVE